MKGATDDDRCCICLEDMHHGTVTLSACRHVFHDECISQIHNDQCPICREPIREGDLPGDGLNNIKKRKREDREEQVEREGIVLQTIEFMPVREMVGLPGSRVFYMVLFELFRRFEPEFLMSFPRGADFASFYHHKLCAFLNGLPCDFLKRLLLLIHGIVFSYRENEPHHIVRDSEEYKQVMDFVLPRARINTRTCVDLMREKYPSIRDNDSKIVEYVREMEKIAMGVELCNIIGQRMLPSRR